MDIRTLLPLTLVAGCALGRTDEAIVDLRAQALARCPLALHEVGAFAATTPLEPGLSAPLDTTSDSGELDGAVDVLTLTWMALPDDRVNIEVSPEDVPDLQARIEEAEWAAVAGVTLDDFLAQDPSLPGCNGTGWLGESTVEVSVGSHDETHTGTLVLLENYGTVFTAESFELELVGPNASGEVFAASAVGADWSWVTLEY